MSTAVIYAPPPKNPTGVNSITSDSTSDLTLTAGTNKNVVLSAPGTGAVQINSTTAGGLQIYNTADKVTDYERFEALWSGNTLFLRTAKGGTGTARGITITSLAALALNAATGMNILTTGGNMTIGTNTGAGTTILVSGSQVTALTLDSSQNALFAGRLQIGGTTSSFPALKRNSDQLEVKAADDSVFARVRLGGLGVGIDAVNDSSIIGAGIINQVASTSTSTGTATTAQRKFKSVTGIANNTATDILTVTIPNAAHSATLKVTLSGSLGAGGAIGANEATGTISYHFSITRTAGVATVTTASTAYGSATSSVAGAATITITAAATAMTGAVGATQTFTVQVTIARGSGSSTNHTCLVEAELLNSNASGVTIV